MANYISNNVDKIEKTILNGIQLALNNCNEDAFNDTHLQELKSKIQQLCKLEEDARNESEIASHFECQGLKTFDSDYKKALDNYRKNHVHSLNSARFQKFVQNVEDICFATVSQGDRTHTHNHSQNQNQTLDLDGPEGADNLKDFPIFTIDPITKRYLVNPVLNTICKHVYEKDSIEEAIRMNPRLRCPYIACGSKAPVQKHHLVEDRELKRRLMALNLGQEKRSMDNDEDYFSD